MSESTYARLSMLIGLRSRVDQGGPGELRFYADPQPAVVEAFPSQAPLAVLTLGEPSGSVSLNVDGLARYELTPNVCTVLESGIIAWAMVVNADGEIVSVRRAGLSTDVPTPSVVVSATQVYTGGELQIISATWVM